MAKSNMKPPSKIIRFRRKDGTYLYVRSTTTGGRIEHYKKKGGSNIKRQRLEKILQERKNAGNVPIFDPESITSVPKVVRKKIDF
jgi:hypothetical protein